MDHYIIWFNLKDTNKAHKFTEDLNSFLSYLQKKNLIIDYKLLRRKLGFGPSHLGEFQLDMRYYDLKQLDDVFHNMITGMSTENELGVLHRKVYSQIKDMQTALYRDFPDMING